MTQLIPVFEGKIVRLRTLAPADYPALKDILNDKISMAALQYYFGADNWTDEMVKERCDRALKAHVEGAAMALVVIDKAQNIVVGNCGFKSLDRSKSQAEFGIVLHRSVWGKGAAREAHLLCLSYGFETLNLETVCFKTSENNLRMQKFFEKYGIPLAKKVEDESLLFEVAKESWPEVKAKLSMVV